MSYFRAINLKHLTDKVLLADTKRLALKEREVTLEILHHLKEIERRRLFSELKYCSLFEYAVKELGYSDAAAARRIHSARLIKELPSLEKKVMNGDLTLSNLAKAGLLFKNENIKESEKKKEILSELEHKSARECDKILMSFKSEPNLPNEQIKRTTEHFTTVKFNFSDETMELFDKVQGQLSHHRFSYDGLFKFVFKSTLTRKETAPHATSPSPGVSRYIPANIKRYVFERDHGKCQKCGSTKWLQYDHILPRSMGGKTSAENLRLLFANCNQRSGITRGIINKAK